MEAGARAWDSCLLDKDTFLENFHLEWWPNKAYLCYETELPSGDPGVPLGQHKDILCNKQMTQPFPASSMLGLPRGGQPDCPAGLCRLQRIQAWELLSVLENRHVTPHPFASHLYTEEGFQNGLRLLWGAGARIAIMTSTGPCGAPGVGGGQGEAWGDWLRRRGQEWNPWRKPLVAAQARLTWDGRGQRSVLEERVGGRRGVWNGPENSGRARETWVGCPERRGIRLAETAG
ncbi:DNA dC-_dU-editing enzyme APOBEC-3G-like [Herpailurus yagouaroundi]|uniref:DNA dC->dU-editing enzyme APOBEC-3G-like n=1 Tax=Herpailurus yagouaroundi TaxID=1608482 RepID=UPI001AD72A58|nr:DNA dC->dU-editing enzyme APOBEC-3G-like [Puma yagouaroundi]XP_040323031.1 DNA dC->dU-editing enzyme APOBEC-3G-like [Puma yagouaroundi]